MVTGIVALIPDVDILLALPVEELAGFVLRAAQSGMQKQNGRTIHLQYVLSALDGHPATGDGGYPVQEREAAKLAISEAWNWLTVQGLLIPEPGSNGHNGWMLFGRRAFPLLADAQAFANFAKNTNFPRSMLHPAIADVWLEMARGDFSTAVFKAFKAVEVAVREAGGFADRDIGVSLMRKAFDKDNGPLTDKALEGGERQALSDLFAGAIGSYKNPHSHRSVSINEAGEAQEMVVLASHLLRIVDSRSPGHR